VQKRERDAEREQKEKSQYKEINFQSPDRLGLKSGRGAGEDNLKDWRPTHKIQLTRKYTQRKGGWSKGVLKGAYPLALVSSLEGVTWTRTWMHTHASTPTHTHIKAIERTCEKQ